MSVPAPPHHVPVGPLAVRWVAYSIPTLRAGERSHGRVEIENAGSATWRSHGEEGVQIGYHWLDQRGNPIVWDGTRTPLENPVAPGDQADLTLDLTAPMPPGPYRLAVDLVHEHRFWFTEIGNSALEVACEIRSLLDRRALVVEIVGETPAEIAQTTSALEAQEEKVSNNLDIEAHDGPIAFLAAGSMPEPDWSRRILDSHEEGFVAVGGAVEVLGGWRTRRARAELAPWAPGFGRVRDWSRPLICPSTLSPVPPSEFSGLPAIDPQKVDGPTLCDGRIRVRLPGGRRPA